MRTDNQDAIEPNAKVRAKVSLIAREEMRRSRRGGSLKNRNILGRECKTRRQRRIRCRRRNKRYWFKQDMEIDVPSQSQVPLNLINRIGGGQELRFGQAPQLAKSGRWAVCN